MKMEHGFTHAQWVDFLDGVLPAAERARMKAHLNHCGECRQLYIRIREWESAIQSEAKLLTAALDRDPEEISLLAARALERIRASGPPGLVQLGFGRGEGVLLLRALLDPLCGSGAARNAVQLATEQSCGAGERTVSAPNWGLFVRNLGAAVGAVYGAPTRVLVERVGGLVGMEVRA
jgi:anti-sigma factor RsiW